MARHGCFRGGLNKDNDARSEKSATQSERPKRKAKPSLKSVENRMQSDTTKLQRLWDRVLAIITKNRDSADTVEAIRVGIKEIRASFHQYQTTWLSYMDFLAHTNTPECSNEREAADNIMNNRKHFLESVVSELEEQKKGILAEIGSIRSSSSRPSTVSSSAMRAQARAEAAAAVKKLEMQKRRSLAESQSIMRIQQEEMALTRRKKEEQAHMESLLLEEEAAVAIAKAKAIDNELGIENPLDNLHELDLPETNAAQKVADFISEQHPVSSQASKQEGPSPTSNCNVTESYAVQKPPALSPPTHHQTKPQQTTPSSTMNPAAPEFVTINRKDPPPTETDSIRSYVDFMARRELIANKIEKFDDNPMNYHTWKASFQNMIKNVTISPGEHLSLLIEYTTCTSKQLVQRLRNAYIANPDKGVLELWKKLDERYGGNAVLVKAHLDRLSSFPKINYGDNKKIQVLADLLLELNCAKMDGVLSGLRVLDEPIYLKPIVTKLPRDVQGRWQRHAFNHMKTHNVHYPPFAEFVDFVEEISREKNDPNLSLTSQEGEKTEGRHRNGPRQTFKTEIPGFKQASSPDPATGAYCIGNHTR